jgi:hypothetical protein
METKMGDITSTQVSLCQKKKKMKKNGNWDD